jgi:hypothetical protein
MATAKTTINSSSFFVRPGLQSQVMGPKHGFQLTAVESTEPVPRGIFSQRDIQLPKSGRLAPSLSPGVLIGYIQFIMRSVLNLKRERERLVKLGTH